MDPAFAGATTLYYLIFTHLNIFHQKFNHPLAKKHSEQQDI